MSLPVKVTNTSLDPKHDEDILLIVNKIRSRSGLPLLVVERREDPLNLSPSMGHAPDSPNSKRSAARRSQLGVANDRLFEYDRRDSPSVNHSVLRGSTPPRSASAANAAALTAAIAEKMTGPGVHEETMTRFESIEPQRRRALPWNATGSQISNSLDSSLASMGPMAGVADQASSPFLRCHSVGNTAKVQQAADGLQTSLQDLRDHATSLFKSVSFKTSAILEKSAVCYDNINNYHHDTNNDNEDDGMLNNHSLINVCQDDVERTGQVIKIESADSPRDVSALTDVMEEPPSLRKSLDHNQVPKAKDRQEELGDDEDHRDSTSRRSGMLDCLLNMGELLDRIWKDEDEPLVGEDKLSLNLTEADAETSFDREIDTHRDGGEMEDKSSLATSSDDDEEDDDHNSGDDDASDDDGGEVKSPAAKAERREATLPKSGHQRHLAPRVFV